MQCGGGTRKRPAGREAAIKTGGEGGTWGRKKERKNAPLFDVTPLLTRKEYFCKK